MFSPDEEKAINMFMKFSREPAEEEFIDINDRGEKTRKILTEADARAFIEDFLGKKRTEDMEKEWKENKVIRDKLIRDLKTNSVLTIKEIAEILGLDRNIVQRAK